MKGASHPVGNTVYLDPDGGVLVHTTCWRPQSGAPNPLKPGEKVVIMSYHPTATEDLCPCGSGKRFGSCCRPLPYWRPVCLNPGMQGYHLVCPQTAHFTNIAADTVHTFLQNDERLYCTEDTPRRTFWTYWGSPALHISQGTPCFGDIELLEGHTLLITAMSDIRMEMLLELVRPLDLGTPHIQQDSVPRLPKPLRQASAKKRRRKSFPG
jgi:SEC-C motif